MKPSSILLLVCACTPSPPVSPPVPPAPVVIAPPNPAPSPTAPPDPAPPTVHDIVGRLSLTKGAQPVIDGRLLSSKTLERHFGASWRDLAGRRFRVRGEKHDYVCDPRAQCLQGGEIPLIQNVTSLQICEDCDVAPAGHQAVPCPVSDAERESCVATCKQESDACDAGASGDRGRLKRCGSRWVGCRSSCQRFADPSRLCR